MTEEKQAYNSSAIQTANVKQYWAEFAVKNAYPNVMTDFDLCAYLPTDQINRRKYPDRQFFWNICNIVRPDFAKEYTKQVMKNRYSQQPVKERTQIKISDDWVQKLTQHDFMSRKSGRGKSSILIKPKKPLTKVV